MKVPILRKPKWGRSHGASLEFKTEFVSSALSHFGGRKTAGFLTSKPSKDDVNSRVIIKTQALPLGGFFTLELKLVEFRI